MTLKILTPTQTHKEVRNSDKEDRENALYSLAADFHVSTQYLIRIKCLDVWVAEYKTVTDRYGKRKVH